MVRRGLFWNRSLTTGYRHTQRQSPRTTELSLMDCREFQKKHVTFVDDLLPAVEMDAMERHLSEC